MSVRAEVECFEMYLKLLWMKSPRRRGCLVQQLHCIHYRRAVTTELLHARFVLPLQNKCKSFMESSIDR